MEISTQSTDLCPKKSIFSTGDQSYGNKSLIFQFLAGLGVCVQIFMLRPCAIAKLKISGHSRLNIK